MIDKIDERNDKFVNAAIAASALTSSNIPPYLALGLSDRITSGEIKNTKVGIEKALQEVLTSK
ncbi:MAG: hypothetical protein HC933_16370 [Pleurocapsa sp. SU_196_0]|nr:hypothetical protein [Pleurocapsa sp. SU_196_0]